MMKFLKSLLFQVKKSSRFSNLQYFLVRGNLEHYQILKIFRPGNNEDFKNFIIRWSALKAASPHVTFLGVFHYRSLRRRQRRPRRALSPYFSLGIFPSAIQNSLSAVSLKTRNRAKKMHLVRLTNAITKNQIHIICY